MEKSLKVLLVASFLLSSLETYADFNIRVGVGHCSLKHCSNAFSRAEANCGVEVRPCNSQATVTAVAITVQCQQVDEFVRLMMNIRDCGEQGRDAERQLKQRCDRQEVTCIRNAGTRLAVCNSFCGTLR